MRFLRIFLVCIVFVYIKHTHSETCDKFSSSRHSWFTSCRPPCYCTALPGRDVYCVLDYERECIGCAKSEYKDTCACSGDECRCDNGERFCNNYCVAREDMCNGKCEGDDRVCKGRCIRRIETCNGKHCGELDWNCNGACIPKTTKCYGKSYSADGCGEGRWECNGVCIPEHQECSQKCNEALGYWMCGSHCRKGEQDKYESNGPLCQRKSTNNNINRRGRNFGFKDCLEKEWECDKKCIKRHQACNGICNEAEGDWKCGSICRNRKERGDWITDGEYCKSVNFNFKPRHRNTDFDTPTCPDYAWGCNGGCIPKATPCDGKCNEAEGGWLCGAICLEQKDKNIWETDGSKCSIKASTSDNDIPENGEETTTTASNIKDSQTEVDQAKTIGISAGSGAAAVLLVGLCVFLIVYRRRKIELDTVIEVNDDYGYGKFYDAITVVDYNEYYGAEEDDETNV